MPTHNKPYTISLETNPSATDLRTIQDGLRDHNLLHAPPDGFEPLTLLVRAADGALLGGDSYEQMGQANQYANKEDLGRFDVTKDEDDKYVFKVPSLRNIALTAPYFHDGQVETLAEAVKQMAWLQLDEELNERQVEPIVAFLGSLTDKERAAE